MKRKAMDCVLPCTSHMYVLDELCTYCGSEVKTDCINYVKSPAKNISVCVHRKQFLRLRSESSRELMQSQKLALVLDIDHTLVHAQIEDNMTTDIVERLRTPHARIRDVHFIPGMKLWIKVRPGVRSMLQELSRHFQLCIATMGERRYATEVVRLLDPDCELFGDRIACKEDFSPRVVKSLDNLLVDPKYAVVVDDIPEVWGQQIENVVHIEKYFYFPAREVHRVSFVEKLIDEDEDRGAISVYRSFLTAVRNDFFETVIGGDVRDCLAARLSYILRGCRVYFTDADTAGMAVAARLGASIVETMDVEDATHVVVGTADRAVSAPNAVFVRQRWLYACMFTLRRVQESLFSRTSKPV
jgi:RNA polymerase II C-terminal domain phosphatase-like 3/4